MWVKRTKLADMTKYNAKIPSSVWKCEFVMLTIPTYEQQKVHTKPNQKNSFLYLKVRIRDDDHTFLRATESTHQTKPNQKKKKKKKKKSTNQTKITTTTKVWGKKFFCFNSNNRNIDVLQSISIRIRGYSKSLKKKKKKKKKKNRSAIITVN